MAPAGVCGSTVPNMSNVKLMLAGDVMIGRGIDQIMPQPCSPELCEQYIGSAIDYVVLAEKAHGPIPRSVAPDYVWGESLTEVQHAASVLRVVNLETSITRRGAAWPKGINYRVSPENAVTLKAAGIDCCVLANNHVLDWGHDGLVDTLRTLEDLGVRAAGAGRNVEEAVTPATFDLGEHGRVIVFACATRSSGTPASWAAARGRAGVNLLADLSDRTADAIAARISAIARPRNVVILSIHWGANWGYDVTPEERRFAHALIDKAPVSIVHGHSSHHPKAVEVHRNRLILYGCGDLLNDYEGISSREEFRSDLGLVYFATIETETGALAALEMSPFRVHRFQLLHASHRDAAWLRGTLDRESRKFGVRIVLTERGGLALNRQRGRT